MSCVSAILTLSVYFIFSSTILGQLPQGFIRTKVAGGLNPTSMIIGPDGRVFITDKNGLIRVMRDDVLLPTPFLQIEVDDANERGLGHMVLHPDFESNGYYYVFYAVPGMRHNRISRFTANGDQTIPGSEKVILDLDPLGADIHNGGDMAFGYDGYLYVSTGEGSDSWNAEILANTNGKMLRMDEYGNPVSDNPWFTSMEGRAPYVFAYGFRNPFSISQHPLTGELFVNDVGGSKYEEVNRIVKGGFYGWPKLEGKKANENLPSVYHDPFFSYAHTPEFCCIVGSAFYYPEHQQFPEQYLGKYFFSDYCAGDIQVLNVETGLVESTFLTDGDRVVDIEVRQDGSLYYLERKGIGDGSQEDNTATANGTMWKVSYTGSDAPFISVQPNSILVSEGESADFQVQASGIKPLTYAWFIDQVLISVDTTSSFNIQNAGLALDSSRVYVEIENAFGKITSDSVLLRVTSNHRPQAILTSPNASMLYTAGDTLIFSGTGEDIEDGLLPDSLLNWRIDFHHGTHAHPALAWQHGNSGGSYVIPVAGETADNVWYRVYLQVSDHDGLSAISFRDIFPRIGSVVVASNPSKLNVGVDGALRRTPIQIEGVRGIHRYLSPPDKQVRGDSIYFFEQWADGNVSTNREISTSMEDRVYVALFSGIPNGRGSGLTAKYFANPDCEGEAFSTGIDTLIDHHFHDKAPLPGLPEDEFSIQWDGYIKPYRSGYYQLTTFADDGVDLTVNGIKRIDSWTGGYHADHAQMYFEQGKLYPVRLRLFDLLYSSQIELRWSSDEFNEEVIPTSQLYPENTLDAVDLFLDINQDRIIGNHLDFKVASDHDRRFDIRITDILGRVFLIPSQFVPAGSSVFEINVSSLPTGWYFAEAAEVNSTQKIKFHFIKMK